MDIDSTGDGTCLDPELLHLSELSPFALKTSPQLAENLFSQWLSLPETGRLVKFISIPNIFFSGLVFVVIIIIYFVCSNLL